MNLLKWFRHLNAKFQYSQNIWHYVLGQVIFVHGRVFECESWEFKFPLQYRCAKLCEEWQHHTLVQCSDWIFTASTFSSEVLILLHLWCRCRQLHSCFSRCRCNGGCRSILGFKTLFCKLPFVVKHSTTLSLPGHIIKWSWQRGVAGLTA